MDLLRYIITPIIGGIIGYITNWLAIKMLFRPHTEKKIFNIKVPFTPGLIPKERHRLAAKVGSTIGEHLLTTDVLQKELTSAKFKKNIEKALDNIYYNLKNNDYTLALFIDHVLEIVLKEDKENIITTAKKNFMENVAPFLKDKTIAQIKLLAQLHITEITDTLIRLLEIKEVNIFLRQLVTKMIKSGLGSLASVFVNTDKIFDNIITSIKEFCSDTKNHTVITDQFNIFVDHISNKITNDNTAAVIMDNINKLKINSIIDKVDEQLYNKIKNTILLKYQDFVRISVPELVNTLNISQIIENRIKDFETSQAEQIIISVVKKELNAITWLGGLLGFIIGLIPLFIK